MTHLLNSDTPTKSSPRIEPWIVRLFGNDRPLGFQGGDTNLFRYVRNDPLDETDPSGLRPNRERDDIPSLAEVRRTAAIENQAIPAWSELITDYTTYLRANPAGGTLESQAAIFLAYFSTTIRVGFDPNNQVPDLAKFKEAMFGMSMFSALRINWRPYITQPPPAHRLVPLPGPLPSSASPILQAAVLALCQQLGSVQFQVRNNADRALRELLTREPHAVAPILANVALETTDLEIRERIRGIGDRLNSTTESNFWQGLNPTQVALRASLDSMLSLYSPDERNQVIDGIATSNSGVFAQGVPFDMIAVFRTLRGSQ